MLYFCIRIHPANRPKLEKLLLKNTFFALTQQVKVATIHGALLSTVSHVLNLFELLICAQVSCVELLLPTSHTGWIRRVSEFID